MTPSTRHSRRFRVIGEEDDPAEALEDLKRKKKAEHKRELKKKEEKGKVDKKKAEAELNATLANLTLPPKSTEPWDIDPGGLPAPGGGPELVVVHRSNLAYVGVEFQETKARAGKTAQSWSLKSGASKDVEAVVNRVEISLQAALRLTIFPTGPRASLGQVVAGTRRRVAGGSRPNVHRAGRGEQQEILRE